MKKNALVIGVLLFSAVAWAKIGVGVQGDLFLRSELPDAPSVSVVDGNAASFVGGSLTVQSNHSPWTFAVSLAREPWYVGVTADNWFVYQALGMSAAYFLFWGISGGAELEESFGVNTGARAGIGVIFFAFARHLSCYAQAAWNPYVGCNLAADADDRFFVRPLSFPVNVGFRVWF